VGQTGNAQIGNSEYLALYGSTNIDLGNGLTSQVYPTQIANNDLGWEKNTQYNVGLDVSLWRGTLGFTADYYYSKTTDMLFDVPVSSVSGLTSSNVNIGSMQNKGIELALTSRRSFGDFSYAFAANWSLNRNKVLSLGDENADIIKESSYAGGYYLTRVGQPVGLLLPACAGRHLPQPGGAGLLSPFRHHDDRRLPLRRRQRQRHSRKGRRPRDRRQLHARFLLRLLG